MTNIRMLSRCLVSAYLLWSLPACNVAPPPADQALLELVENSVEWSTDNDSYFGLPKLIDKINDIQDATNKSFDQVARIKFKFDLPKTTILSYFPESSWPIIDPTDPQYPPNSQNERWYQTWVQNQRDQNIAFGVYWVIGPPTNHPAPAPGISPVCGPQPKILGFTLPTLADNDVPTQVTSRGSVVFTGWIYELTQCSPFNNNPAINFYIRVHTHEMGHQRADLTHTDNIAYHGGPVPSPNQGRDVMEANIVAGDLGRTVPIFDQHYEQASEANPCYHLTCQDNLVCWRSIRN